MQACTVVILWSIRSLSSSQTSISAYDSTGKSSIYRCCTRLVIGQSLMLVASFFQSTGATRGRQTSITGLWDCTLSARSEEHTSELQSLTNLVCRLLLEKKKTNSR